MGFALAHAKQAPVHHLESIGFQGDQDEEQSIFGCRQGQLLYTANWRAVRGFPSRRHAAIWAWNAASVVYLSPADKSPRLTHRPSQGQKGIGSRALLASQRPSH